MTLIYPLSSTSFAVGNKTNSFSAGSCQLHKITIKDAMPVSFRSELFTSYILTIFNQRNPLQFI